MTKNNSAKQFVEQVMDLLPDDLGAFKNEIEQNLKLAITASLKRMDLVTREEFDVQKAVLLRTRQMLDELEEKVRKLEEEQK